MSPPFLFTVALFVALLQSASHVAAREVLPPHAYFNRTMHPPLYTYETPPHLSIGLISDVQYAEIEETKRRHFKMSPMKLASAVADMNANRTLDFVVHLGDLVDHAMHVNMPPVMAILKKLTVPLFHVLGNHDFEQEDMDKVPALLGLGSRYYSFTQKDYRFVVLDGNDVSMYATHPGTPKRKAADNMLEALVRRKAKNAQRFNGGLDKEQLEWMRSELTAACDKTQRVVVFVHHPMRPKDEPTNLWNDLDVVRVIIGFPCVVAVINGHAHKFMYDYHHAMHGDVHFITMGGMVQSPFTSYGFLDVFDDTLHLHGLIFGRAISYTYNISRNVPPSAPRESYAHLPKAPVVTFAPSHPMPPPPPLVETETVTPGQVPTHGREVSAMVSVVTLLIVALYTTKRRRQPSDPSVRTVGPSHSV